MSDYEHDDIITTGSRLPFVQVGMVIHPEDCHNCERGGNAYYCCALVCEMHDSDSGMDATLRFRNGRRIEVECRELRQHWRLLRDFDQTRVYTGRWSRLAMTAEVEEDA